MRPTNPQLFCSAVRGFAAATLLALAVPALAATFNEEAAKETAKRNDCFKCHAVDKTKKGPSYQKIAAKFKGKSEAEIRQKVYDNLTKAPLVKLEDGTEEKHKVIDTKDTKEIDNLMYWIISR